MIHAIITAMSDRDLSTLLMTLLSFLFVIFVTMPVHEWAHGFAAHLMGDDTAKYNGRLTLNPMAHIDPIGSTLVLLFGFGWAKPVPINIGNFKNKKVGMAVTAFAGPLANIIMAFILSFICALINFLFYLGVLSDQVLAQMLVTFFATAAMVNVSLGVFNLIPITPLDGSRILAGLLPDKLYYKYLSLDRYAYIFIVAILVLSSQFDVISDVSNAILNLFFDLWMNVFNLII